MFAVGMTLKLTSLSLREWILCFHYGKYICLKEFMTLHQKFGIFLPKKNWISLTNCPFMQLHFNSSYITLIFLIMEAIIGDLEITAAFYTSAWVLSKFRFDFHFRLLTHYTCSFYSSPNRKHIYIIWDIMSFFFLEM